MNKKFNKENDNQNKVQKIEINENILENISKGKILKKLIKNLHTYSEKFVSIFIHVTITSLKISGVYLLWICLHYFSAHLYISFCVPNTVVGFIMSPFMITTPHCQGLRWVVYSASNIINNMWILIGAWIYSMIWIIERNIPTNSSE